MLQTKPEWLTERLVSQQRQINFEDWKSQSEGSPDAGILLQNLDYSLRLVCSGNGETTAREAVELMVDYLTNYDEDLSEGLYKALKYNSEVDTMNLCKECATEPNINVSNMKFITGEKPGKCQGYGCRKKALVVCSF